MSYDNEKPVFGGNTGLENNGANEVSRGIDLKEINFNEGTFDPVAAVEFACRFGPPNIIKIKNGVLQAVELPTRESALQLLESDSQGDFYLCPATLRDAFSGKPKKTDCIGSNWAWVDIDPPKGMIDADELKTWREQALLEIRQTDLPPPQIIVFSGRGLWLYWRLSYRVPSAEVEKINYGVANRFGGGDSCHSIDHIARLPFTRNSKTGLVGFIIRDVEGVTDVAKLPSEAPRSSRINDGPDLGEFGEIKKLSEDNFRTLVAALPCKTEKQNELILAALHPERANEFREKPINISDRSAVMFSWAIKAIMADMKPEDVRNCILSPELQPISAHLLDFKKYPPSMRDCAALRNVRRAHSQALENGWKAKDSSQNPVASEEAAPHYELISLAPVPDDLPPRPWLVEGALMNGQVSMLTGRGGEGKSLLALQFGMMVAMGGEFGWWNSRHQRNVLVLNAEDNFKEQQRRVLSASEVMGIQQKALDQRLFMLNTDKLVLVHRDPEDNKIKTTALYDYLIKLIKDRQIGLLVIDPLVEAHVNLDENSNVDMKEVIIALRKLARICDIPVLIVHHSRKGAAGGDQDGARGGSSLVNACRIVLTLDRMDDKTHQSINPQSPKENYVRVTGAKANYAGRVGDRWLELESVLLYNGDYSPGMKKVVFGEAEQGFDLFTWQHHEAFLELVRKGRGDGRLWSTATTGSKAARLNVAVVDRFKVDSRFANMAISRFAEASLITTATQKDRQRKDVNVWIVGGQKLPPDTKEIPF